MRFIVLLFTLLTASAADRRLFIISIDALQPSTLAHAEQLGARVPNLIEMRDHGALSAGLTGVFPTVTYPSHTTLVTGRLPADHGIYANTVFDPEGRLMNGWFAYAEAIRVPTLWDLAHRAGLRVGAVSWPVSIGAAIDYNIPEFYPLRSDDLVMLHRAVSTPGLFAAFEKEYGRVTPATVQDDLYRAAQAAYIVRTHKPDLLLVHFLDVDEAQHEHGPASPEALRALERVDQAIGILRRADPGATWLIVSDHGFWPVSQLFHPQAFLASLGLAAPEGNRAAWRVAAHTNGGSVEFVVKDPHDTEAQKLVCTELERLKNDPRYGIGAVLDRAALDKLHAYPLAFAAISMSRGFARGPARSGAWVTPSGDTRGTHGYLPGPSELDATFLAYGPGIAERALPHADLTSVAPTAAALLGLQLPGRNLLAAH